MPNPVQSLGDESLTDQKDSDAAVPAAALPRRHADEPRRQRLPARRLRERRTARPATRRTRRRTRSATRAHQDEFEQVMAYYWITEAQTYIQSLGFGSRGAPINNAAAGRADQPARASTTRSRPTIRRTSSASARAASTTPRTREVILHEYGHAIHFSQNFIFASEEAGAISEGFGDYWAVTVSDVVSTALGVPELEPLPCVADWDSTSYTSDRSRTACGGVDTNLHYPADLNGEVHHDGQIWSRALWDIRAGARPRQGRHDHPAGVVRLPGHDHAGPREPRRSRPRRRSTDPARRPPCSWRSTTAASCNRERGWTCGPSACAFQLRLQSIVK